MSLSAQVADDRERPFVVGPSRQVREILDLVRKVARLSATVLILGESGTGKELLARMIHRESERADGPFMVANLAAIPGELMESNLFGHEKGSFTGAVRQQLGKFELADGGTLFLDEIGELKPDLQAKLLRAIQESEIERVGGGHPIRVDLRIVAATNVDLEKAVRDGRFREDLYYRINVIPMKVPPLRERAEDLPTLAAFFLGRYNTKFRKQVLGIEEPAMAALLAYPWPGNIRELENLMERLVAVSEGDWIRSEDLPYEYHLAKLTSPEQVTEGLFDRACEMFERNFILKGLEQAHWNVSATARNLGMPLSTLKFKMDRLDIREIARKLRGAGLGS
jgi:transcriptional regulator with PAS, ATPase and Fis domain